MDIKTYSALSKKEVTIPAYSVSTVDYMDTTPNYFRVQNNGKMNVYCGISSIPTESRYDFIAPAEGLKMFADPFKRSKLYIYNPSATAIHCVVLSFQAPFEPLTLAFSDLKLDFSGTVMEANTVISGFKGSLPAGANKIGLVGIDGAIPAGNNVIGKVIVTEPDYYTETQSDNATESGVVFDTIDGYLINNLCFMSNDGESELTLSFIDYLDGATHNISLKAGEVLNDIKCKARQLKVSGSSVPFRMVYNLREV